MRRTRTIAAAFSVIVVTLLCIGTYAFPQTPDEGVRAALSQQNAWLGQDANAVAWRAYLLDEQLEGQLAAGAKAEPLALAKVLARYRSGAPGLDLKPFAGVREALTAWLRTLPPPPAEQLPALARASKQVFFAYTEADVAAAKAELGAAIGRLDAYLESAGPRANDWRGYLTLENLKEQLARPQGPDLPTLDAIYLRLASGYEGLQLVWFADVRKGLWRYLTTTRAKGQPQLAQQYEKLLVALADTLEENAKKASDETVRNVNLVLDWLDQAGQAPWLVSAVRQRLSHPNLFVEVSGSLVSSRVGGPVRDTSPIVDCILGTEVHGTGHTTGELTAELVPSPDSALIDVLFQGEVASDTIGYNGPVTIFSTGITSLSARKRLTLDSEQFSALPAASSAVTSTEINDIQAKRGIIERMAWKRAGKQKSEAEYIAARHAEERFNERMDQEADPMIARANAGFLQKFRGPLVHRNLFPSLFRLSTTKDAVQLTVREDGQGHLAAPGEAPAIGEAADLTLRVHESAINNLTAAALGGVVLDEKRMQEIVTETFGLPERVQTGGDEEQWTITFPQFADRPPVQVSFADGGFSVTISGRQYMNEGREYPGMDVTAVYKIEKTGRGLRAVRQGKLRIFPPGFTPDSGQQLSGRLQVLRTALEPRFGRFFTEELAPRNIVLKDEGAAGRGEPRPPTELTLARWETVKGWLVMAWKRVPPAPAPPADAPKKPAIR